MLRGEGVDMGFLGRGACLLGLALISGCAATQGNRAAHAPGAARSEATSSAPGQKSAPAAEVAPTLAATGGLRHVDQVNGFEIERPSEAWTLHSGEELSTEVILVPVVLLEEAQGAQVIVQIAPAIATPPEFAERLIEGLSSRGEFTTGEVHPIDMADGAVGFDFSAAEQVLGRVAILDGSDGKVFVLLATWPVGAPQSLDQEIDAILGSMKVL